MIVYGLDLMKLLVMPVPGFKMVDEKKFEEYKTANKGKSAMLTPIMKLGKGCWSWMAEHSEVERRVWCEEILSDELLTELDEAFQMHFTKVEDYLFVDEHDGWRESMEKYQAAVVDIFDKYICKKTWVEDSQQAVRTMLPRKLEWIFMDHQFHYGAVLPIMTVSTINALVRCLDRVSLAI